MTFKTVNYYAPEVFTANWIEPHLKAEHFH
jgi:hypothetical protein